MTLRWIDYDQRQETATTGEREIPSDFAFKCIQRTCDAVAALAADVHPARVATASQFRERWTSWGEYTAAKRVELRPAFVMAGFDSHIFAQILLSRCAHARVGIAPLIQPR